MQEVGCFMNMRIHQLIGFDERNLFSIFSYKFFDFWGKEKKKTSTRYEKDKHCDDIMEDVHHMIKEIKEIPMAIHSTATEVEKCLMMLPKQQLKKIKHIVIAGCGTAYHAGLTAKTVIEKFTQIPVTNEIASELTCCNPLVGQNALVILVSQSGETADTISALDIAKKKGALTVAVVNNAISPLALGADFKIITHAKKECAIASTKAYNSQLIALYSFALYFAKILKSLPTDKIDALKEMILDLPATAREVIEEGIERIDDKIISLFKDEKTIMFLGRGIDYATAREASLKLKEVTYIHCESYPAGELKHGSLALIEKDYLVVAYLTDSSLKEKMINALNGVKARGAKVFAITNQTLPKNAYDYIYEVPKLGILSPITSIIPMQIISYLTSVVKGINPDKPRNLTKAVTVV